jgi:hypothetical protein
MQEQALMKITPTTKMSTDFLANFMSGTARNR